MKEFIKWRSISRLSRDMIITEKLDGTNAQIHIDPDGGVFAGSRNRWITVEDDNFGFARWVKEHEDILQSELGIGTHYGEWWGAGIQRTYNIAEKRFSLFDASRWRNIPLELCCVVPILYEGVFDTNRVDEELLKLQQVGSVASPGFMNPEGIVVLHIPSRTLFKKTLDKNDGHKG